MACLATVALLFLLCGGVESQETVSKSRSAERTYVYRSTTRLADQNDFTLNGKVKTLYCIEILRGEQKNAVLTCFQFATPTVTLYDAIRFV